jgi:hypothetical protein
MAYNTDLLKPTRNIAPHDIRDGYRTDYTGQAGFLVKVTNFDPDDDTFYAQNTSVGAGYDGIYSNKWIAPRVVSKAGASDVAGSVLGITLEGTASVDNHGNLIDGFNKRWADENGYVASGKPVQIATRGNFWIAVSQINGNPQPGSGLAPAADGKFLVVDPVASGDSLVGKVLSSSGSRQGDVNIELTL